MAIPALLSYLLYYNSEYNVLCCKAQECLQALEPSSAPRHYSTGKHSESLVIRKAIAEYIALTPSLQARIGDLPRPLHGSLPQPHLRISSGLHQCNRCQLIKKNEKKVREHINKDHQVFRFKSSEEITEVSGQTWLIHSNAHYWRVNWQEDNQNNLYLDSVVEEEAISNAAHAKENHINQTHYKLLLQDEQGKMEEEKALQWRQLGLSRNLDQVSPWLKMTGWINALSDLPGSLEELAALTEAPQKDEIELQMLSSIFKETVIPRCMGTVANVPHAYLTWLKSAQSTIDGPKPFSAPGDAATLPRYTNYWVQYICFLFRSLAQGAEILEPEGENYPGLPADTSLVAGQDFKTIGGLYLTSALHAKMRRINEQLSFLEDIDSLDDINKATRELLASFLFKLSLLSVQSELHLNSPYKSSLMLFLAHMGIDAKKHTLREPHTYTYVLAGIQYICRILVLESTLSYTGWEYLDIPQQTTFLNIDHHIPKENEEDTPMIAFQKQRRAWLVQGNNTPMGIILKQLAYGKAICKVQSRAPCITWNQRLTVLYLRDLPLEMGEFREAVKSMISNARLLIDKLLMGFKPDVKLENIEDDTCKSGTYDSRGYNFLQQSGNLLDKGIEPMIQAALAKKGSRRLVDIETAVKPDGTPTTIPHWRRSECCKYIEHEHEFMDLLLICIHLTGGQPARGPEIGSIKHVNSTQSSRNIFVLQGLVAIVTCYDKSRTMRDSMHYIVRYLPQEVGLMVVEYLAYVRPFVTAIERGQPTHRSSEYFWIGCKDPFKDTYVTKIFKQMMQKYLGRNLNLRDYRHIAIAIAREFLHEDLAIFGIDPEEIVVEDELSVAAEDQVLDLQAAHSTGTAERAYAVDFRYLKSLNGKLLRVFRKASVSWHNWLGVGTPEKCLTHLPKRDRALTTTTAEPPAKRQDLSTLVSETQKASSKAQSFLPVEEKQDQQQAMHHALCQILGPNAAFRSPDCLQSMKQILEGKRNGTIHVQATGSGKSLYFFVLALMMQSRVGTVLVVVPYVALQADLLHRALEYRICAINWSSPPTAQMDAASLVFASADQVAANPALIQWGHRLAANGLLKHIFLDECHVALTDTQYRENLRHLLNLRLIDAPLACLTATLPPCLEPKFRNEMLLPQANVFRSSTVQKHIRYRVIDCNKKNLVTVVTNYVQECEHKLLPGEKGVIFVRTIAFGNHLAKELACPFYHSNADEKAAILQDWADGQHPWIVATGALGTGVHIPAIREIVHVDRPYGMINYVQQAGRGGRNGFLTTATLFLNLSSWKKKTSDATSLGITVEAVDENALTLYMESSLCRRQCLAHYMDGALLDENSSRTCIEQSLIACDLCEAQQAEAHEKAATMVDESIFQVASPLRLGESAAPEYQEEAPASVIDSEPEKPAASPAIISGATLHARHKKNQAAMQACRLANLRVYENCCIFCRVVLEISTSKHTYEHCPRGNTSRNRSGWLQAMTWKKKIRFAPYTACFQCGLTQEECGRDILEDQPCRYCNIMFFVLFLLFKEEDKIEQLRQLGFDKSIDSEMGGWLVQECPYESGQTWLAHLFGAWGSVDDECDEDNKN